MTTKPLTNEQQRIRKRIQKLASDIKDLLQLDACEAGLVSGKLWLRLQLGDILLDCPVETASLFDTEQDNRLVIKQTIIAAWIAHLENERQQLAGAVMHGQ